MTISKWEPLRDIVSLREAVNRLFEESYVRPSFAPTTGTLLPMDIYETPDEVVVSAPLPGVKPDEVDITVQGDNLTIKGEFKTAENGAKANYLLAERRYGAFSRSITLPVTVVADKASAEFKDGVLTLKLPKADELKPKTIKVMTK